VALGRTGLLTYLNNLSPAAAALATPAITNNDNAANWGPAIDNTLLLMEVAYDSLATGTVPAGKERDGLAIAKMFGLELLCEKLAADVANDVTDKAVSEHKSNVLAQLRAQWASQVNRVEGLGYQVERQSSSYGDWDLDIYEPGSGSEL
jgi:hypothetical protein